MGSIDYIDIENVRGRSGLFALDLFCVAVCGDRSLTCLKINSSLDDIWLNLQTTWQYFILTLLRLTPIYFIYISEIKECLVVALRLHSHTVQISISIGPGFQLCSLMGFKLLCCILSIKSTNKIMNFKCYNL